ncbi:Probable E3 ubiquitin-protein ligase HERC4 (HECT domain and RCC1-like domain-containing protein 4) (HECT-type E3 ubiquitin transferase HERC4) [Durusdinium trenchii]|uniref:Probable E3 ubiquitin-protein ligase HERC4 (HECT domain and RCC1-like domain-containing protein 4) (HECT-type E3 ubiquitin transferase HERC4) n=2 Tax=Durusdinium trenchii TaxID=1381693 RepID=A0ABP0R4G6_9DINO
MAADVEEACAGCGELNDDLVTFEDIPSLPSSGETAESLLEQMIEGDEAVKASSPQLIERFQALQKLLSLHDSLATLARKVVSCLASEAQWPSLVALLRKCGHQVEVSNILSLALSGFHLQGVFFRMIVEEDDWKTVCNEVRWARESRGPLLLALEGMGLRLLASPVLEEPWSVANDAPGAMRTRRMLLEYSQQLRLGTPTDLELQRAVASLPNPRRLLSLEVPLSFALARTSGLKVPLPCLGLVFGAGGELTSLRCGRPQVLQTNSLADLLDEVAKCFSCSTQQLKCHSSRQLFGCPCEVWHLPEAGGNDQTPVWEWQSNNFAVLFAAPMARFLRESEDPRNSFTFRLQSVAQQLEPGLLPHPSALRSLLRVHRLPARFAVALAEMRLVGVRQLLMKNQAHVEELVAVDMVGRAAKHAVRHILTRRQTHRAFGAGSSWGDIGPSTKEALHRAPLQRFWAVDASPDANAPTSGAGYDWTQLIATEAQLLPSAEVSSEAPIPALPGATGREKCEEAEVAELEAQLMISALQVHPDLAPEHLVALRQGLLQVAFWVRLASVVHELALLQTRDKDPSRASSLSTSCSDPGHIAAPRSLLAPLGPRFWAASRRSPWALVHSTARMLRTGTPKDVMTARLRVHSTSLNVPMRTEATEATWSGPMRRRVSLQFHEKGVMSYADALSELLLSSGEINDEHQSPRGPSASAQLAAELLTHRDFSLGRSRLGLLQRTPPAPSVVAVATALAKGAALAPRGGKAYVMMHKGWRAKALLQLAQYHLLPWDETADALAAASKSLKAAAQLMGELGTSCPPELFASFFTLRGVICEREGDVDACYLHYLQALATLDDAYGDPRKPGGRGHPFAAFLVWKLGLISYCRSDTKCIVKFGDYFRSLALSYEETPFSWGPRALSAEQRQLLSEASAAQLLRVLQPSSELLWPWWWRHDPLHFSQEAFLPVRSGPVREEEVAPANHSVTGERQDVFRGTVFACGVNELGQLGTGEDLPWSGQPVRVVALKEVRIREVACGESHCLALDLEGHLYTWGFDGFSQVDAHFVVSPMSSPRGPRGDESRAAMAGCQIVPKPRPMLPTVSFARIACGAQFSLALDNSGAVWSWGHSDGGVLGLGPSRQRGRPAPEPTKLALPGGDVHRCSWVACGSYHAFAISEGQLFSWGRTEGGQLGLDEAVIQKHIEELQLEDTYVCLPQRVEGLPALSAVAGGDVHSLALGVKGEIYSWGWGEFGQLGLGFSSSSFQVGFGGASSRRPQPQPVPLKSAALQVECGGAFSAALLGQVCLCAWGMWSETCGWCVEG